LHFCLGPAWGCDPPSVPPLHTTVLACWLRWSLANFFLPGLAWNCCLPDLCFLGSWYYRCEPSLLPHVISFCLSKYFSFCLRWLGYSNASLFLLLENY
jgi:hypothetical protein